MRYHVFQIIFHIVTLHELNMRLHSSYLFVVDELFKHDAMSWDEEDVRSVMETLRSYARTSLPSSEQALVVNVVECILETRITKIQQNQRWWCCVLV
jgi:hypothetical protein